MHLSIVHLLLRNLAVPGVCHMVSFRGAVTALVVGLTPPSLEASGTFFQSELAVLSLGTFYLIPIVLSGVSFSLVFPLLFFSSLAFSSLPLVFLCKQDCFHHCRKHPLSLAGFSELAFCFGQRILSGDTVRDNIS